ncbi:jerky protein homolog-like [Phlebotomus papatasi]|uniref:jerky protein homolog-like n=1 Tax=Phlebotomus papatasi TaxID=29031 RepID=UPI0024834749|nr:jerky protein homolog-like [Phlebotomus papatasi]
MPGKPVKRKQYTQDDVEKALKAFRSGKSVREAAKQFNVPKTTIFNKLTGKFPVQCRNGPPTTLTPGQEQELVKWILDCSDRWHPITKDQVLDSVELTCKHFKIPNKFSNGRPGHEWFRGFMKRHPELSRRIPERYTMRRASVTHENVRNWFSHVGDYLTQNNLKDLPPNRVFNCDESGFFLAPKGEKVLVRRGDRVAGKIITSEEKECVTVLFTVSASGELPPPMVVHPIKKFTRDIAENNVDGWLSGKSDSGWMTSSLFFEYIANHFYPWLKKQRIELPVVLYLDGHSSHITLEVSKFCKEKGIELIRLYPNATHLMQPLDTAFFAPLKIAWRKALCKWMMANDWVKLKRRSVPKVLFEALKALNLEVIAENGFRGCGLLPFNPDAIKKERFRDKNESSENTTVIQTAQNDVNEDLILPADDYAAALRFFGAHLSPTTLESFTKCDESNLWDGPVEQEGLFKLWQNAKRLYEKARSPEIDSTCDKNESFVDINDVPIVIWDAEPTVWNLDNSDGHLEEVANVSEVNQPAPHQSTSPHGDPAFSEPLSVECFLKNYLYSPKDLPKKKNVSQEPSILTSDQNIATLEEKENKKKQLIEEKEQRKVQREIKRKIKEEEQKNKKPKLKKNMK